MPQLTLNALAERAALKKATPYEIPHRSRNRSKARKAHREWYWTLFDYDDYECPDCGRGVDEVQRFEVHHIDRDPLNGALWNLQGVCQRCHGWRHGQREDISGLTVEEWKEAFVDQSFSPVY